MKRQLIFFFLAVFTTLFTEVAVYAQADLQPVAIVRLTRSEPITVRQLKTEAEKALWPVLSQRLNRSPTAAELAREVQNFSMDDRRQLLEVTINERLALQAAERDRITVTDNELNQQIAPLREQMSQAIGRPPTEEEFALAVKAETGQDVPAFRESLRRRLIIQKYMMAQKGDILNNVKQPTEAEVLNIYNLSKASMVRPETVRFSMIQVAYGPDAASKNRAKELIDRLNREIGTNASRFDEAVMRGQAPNSGYMAGDGGYLPRNLMAQQRAGQDFVDVAFSLKQGEVSRVIEGIPGYQIIKITETLPQKALELDEIAEPGTRITVRQYITMNLAEQRMMEAQNQATMELITELRTGNPFQIMENNLNW